MTTKEYLYKLKLESDNVDSKDFEALPLAAQILVANKVILMCVEACYGINNLLREGFEVTQKRIDQLQILIVKDKDPFDYIENPGEENTFYADYSSIIDNNLHTIRTFSYANKDNCSNRILFNTVIKHSEANEVKQDPNRLGNFEYQDLPISFADNKIYCYTDGSFTPTKVKIEYIKYPTKIDLIGYTHFDQTSSSDVDSELPDVFLEYTISVGAKFLRIIMGDLQQGQGLEQIKQEQG